MGEAVDDGRRKTVREALIVRVGVMLSLPLFTCAFALSACGDDVSSFEQQEADAQAVAMVEEANSTQPPLEELVPEPITETDMQAEEMGGERCTYSPGMNHGVLVVARQVDAYMKIDGRLVRFAADPGARQLPFETRTLYNGRQFSLRLNMPETEAEGTEAVAGTEFEGDIALFDQWDRLVYSGSGPVICTPL
jgi:hypothetical protein